MSTSTAKPSQVKKQSQENAKKPSTNPTGPSAKDTTSKSKLLLALKEEVLRLRTELQEEREEREKISSWLAQTLKPRLKEQFDELRETSETHEQQIGAIKNFLRDNRGALSSGGADSVSRKDFEELEKQLAIEREARQQLSLWIKSQFGKNLEVLDSRIAAQLGKTPSTPALPAGGAVIKPTVSVLPDSVPEWLRMIGYERYIDEFQRFKCTELDKVTRLTDDHLVKMGIGLKRHRGDLLHEVASLRSKLENKDPEPLGSAFPATPKRNSSVVVESPVVDPFTESDIEDKIEEEYKERDRKRREEKAWEEQERERIRKEIEAEERARIEADRARSEAERKKAERARALQEEKEQRERQLEGEREREKARLKAEKDRQREKERERIRKELEAEERARIDEERKKSDREEQTRLKALEQERKEIERKQKQLEKERADLEKQRKSLETKRAPVPEPEPARDDSSSEDLFSPPPKAEPKSTPKTAKKPTRKEFSDSEDDIEVPPEKPAASSSAAVAKRDSKPKETASASSGDGRSNEEYIADVRSDNDATNWVIFYYDKQSNSVKYGGSGAKGHAELLSHFEEDKVQYALLRVVDANSRIKFVYIQWIGPSANFMVKSRSGTCKAGVLKMIGQFHIEIIAESLDDISKKAILSKLQAAVNF